jgi:hypothetical protein
MDGLYLANHCGWLWDGNTMKKCFLPAHHVCLSILGGLDVWTTSVRGWFTLANILFQHNVHSFHKNVNCIIMCNEGG